MESSRVLMEQEVGSEGRAWACGLNQQLIIWYVDSSLIIEEAGAKGGKFQAEISPADRCAYFKLERIYSGQNIVIPIDSQAAIKALTSN